MSMLVVIKLYEANVLSLGVPVFRVIDAVQFYNLINHDPQPGPSKFKFPIVLKSAVAYQIITAFHALSSLIILLLVKHPL